MTHPGHEEWVPYLYGESPAQDRRALKHHLRNCPQCRDQLTKMRAGLKRLDAWKLPRADAPAGPVAFAPWKWAVAALVLLVAGFALGRFGGSGTSLAQARASLKTELRNELRKEMAELAREQATQAAASSLRLVEQETERLLAAYAKGLQAQRADDRQTIEAAMARLESRRLADLAALKRELDTLAVNTVAGLRNTAEGLVLLASHRQSPSPTTTTE